MSWQTISTFLLHPVIFYLLEHLLIILIFGFTSADSFLRPAVFPIIFACIWRLTSIFSERAHRTLWAAIMSGYFVGGLFIYVESALISKWAFEAQGPTSSAGPEPLHATHAHRNNRGGSAITTQTSGGSFWERCRFGFLVTTSSRNIGTPNMSKIHLLSPLTTPIIFPHAQLFFVERLSSSLSPFWPSTSQVRVLSLGSILLFFSPQKPYPFLWGIEKTSRSKRLLQD